LCVCVYVCMCACTHTLSTHQQERVGCAGCEAEGAGGKGEGCQWRQGGLATISGGTARAGFQCHCGRMERRRVAMLIVTNYGNGHHLLKCRSRQVRGKQRTAACTRLVIHHTVWRDNTMWGVAAFIPRRVGNGCMRYSLGRRTHTS
jgi:hypothetical protein